MPMVCPSSVAIAIFTEFGLLWVEGSADGPLSRADLLGRQTQPLVLREKLADEAGSLLHYESPVMQYGQAFVRDFIFPSGRSSVGHLPSRPNQPGELEFAKGAIQLAHVHFVR